MQAPLLRLSSAKMVALFHPDVNPTGFAIKYTYIQKRCLSSRLLHFTSANTVLSTPSGFSAPRSQSSSGLAALCFCVQMDETQIPDSHIPRMVIPRDSINSGVHIGHRFSGIIQHQSLKILRHHLLTGNLTKSSHSPDGVFRAHAL